MNMKATKKSFNSIALAALLSLTLAQAKAYAQDPAVEKPAAPTQVSPSNQSTVRQTYQELFELSQKENRGLTFFVNGQTIPGIVTKILGEDAVEVRNRTYGRLIIPLDRIDALALN